MPGTYDLQNLQNFHFFSQLSEARCLLLRDYLACERFAKGELIAGQGQRGDRMFLVVQGTVRREKMQGMGFGESGPDTWKENEIFEEKGPGDSFCEQVIVGDYQIKGDWVALEDVELLSLSVQSFREIQSADSGTAGILMQSLCRSLGDRCQQYEEQLVVGLENEKLLQQMRIERKKINAMHQIARSTAVSSVSQTLDTILSACIACLQVEKGSIMIFDKGVLRVEAAFGPNKQKILGQEQSITEQSVSGRCFISKKPVFTQDIEQEMGLSRSPDPSQYWNNSLISMPLISHMDESIGVLNVSKTSQEVFTEEDLQILSDLALEASTALGYEISLARLYSSFQETFVEVKHAQKQLARMEEKICKIIQTSWPALDHEGVSGNE